MTNIWRIHTNTHGENVADYCIENGVVALGWSLYDGHIDNHFKDLEERSEFKKERNKIHTIDDYEKLIKKYNLHQGEINGNLIRMTRDVKVNDLIWLRSNGIYYLGRVTENSSYNYNHDEFSMKNDATNQLTNIKWYKVGDVSNVPGSLPNRFIKGSTLQRIHDGSIHNFSKLKYNEKSGKNIYKDFNFENNSFISLLTPEDVEDLLGLWLFKEKGYITIPSTNKETTELYEYVMIDPKTGKSIFTQVKQGHVSLDAKDFIHLDGDVWLLTTEGSVLNKEISERIKVADSRIIEEFALSEENSNLLPNKIKKWIEYYKDFLVLNKKQDK